MCVFPLFFVPLQRFTENKRKVGKFDPYKVDLKNMSADIQTFEYKLDNVFFSHIGSDDIQKGKLTVNLTVKKVSTMYEFNFRTEGTIVVPCDRCLDDMELPIETTENLIVKLGKDYSEESDKIVVIPESEGIINLSWFLYEFIMLAIPIKHVHAPGKCNIQMTSKLRKHSPKSEDDEQLFESGESEDGIGSDDSLETEEKTDPRWEALKGLRDD